MKKIGVLILVQSLWLCAFVRAATPEAKLPQKHLALLENYCFDCHDSETQKGKVNLEGLSFEINDVEQAVLWRKVLNAMNAGEMPPEKKPQPEGKEKADFLDDLANTMVAARKALSDTGGEITMRRLNRREYQNSIEYLTGVRVDAGTLPADGGGGGFDTEGASQFISSDQIEQYLKLGRSAIGELFERRAAVGQEPKVFRVEPEKTVNVKSRKRMAQQEEEHERYLRWKAEVDKIAFLPENEAALEQIRKKYKIDDLKDNLRLYQNTGLLKGAPDATKFGFRDGNQASFSYQGGYGRTYQYMKHYLELPNSDRGTYLKLAWGIQRIDVTPEPKEIPPGTYKLRIRAGTVKDSDPSRHFIEVGHPQRVNQVPAGFSSKPLSSLQVTGTEASPEIIETTLVIGSDTPRDFGIQERRPEGNQKALSREFYAHKRQNGYGTPPAIWVDWIELVGPISDNAPAESTVTRVEPEKTINPENEKEVAKIEDGYARFTKWKKAVDKAAATPENQAIIAEIRKTERLIDHPNRFYSYADRFVGAPHPKEFGIVGDAKKAAGWDPEADRRDLAYHKHYTGLPHRDCGTYLKLAHGTGRVIISHKKNKLPPGSYILRVAAAAVEGSPASRHFIEVGHPQRQIESRNWGLEGQPISSHQVTGTIEKPEVIEIPLEVGTDTIKEFAIQEKQPNNGNLKALWNAHNALKKENGYGHPPAIWIDWIELEGPHGAAPSGSDRDDSWLTDTSGPDDSSRARAILQKFAFKAFRGVEAEADFLDRLVSIYEARRDAGESFNNAIELPLGIILASPGFLYLSEPSDDSERRELTDRELAVRLAYFLWSAPPDQQLLDLASEGELSKPEVLRKQVNRLIADSRSGEFVAGFLHQWLDMERLDFFQFDTTLHREFDESTRSAARQEVYHSFAHLLRDPKGGRLGKLLKSDTVFVNGLLATYYGIDGVTGDEFQQVALPADSPRGGLLGMAAIHAMGSDGIESSPVERGVWVLRHLLNDPPPPAPPNVPQLSRLADQPLSKREKLAAHMEEAQCASCHRKIDPIGFGLENFDAAGKWRTEERLLTKNRKGKLAPSKNATPIDVSGQFHNGPAFANYDEMRDLIAARVEDFARGFTEHLVGYGLGRPFGFTDEDLANEIVAAAKEEDYTISAIIRTLVLSEPFRQK